MRGERSPELYYNAGLIAQKRGRTGSTRFDLFAADFGQHFL